ncbi:hypothetical protein PMAYCL1PPCAC_26882, partial [Pristionchus mayeri]
VMADESSFDLSYMRALGTAMADSADVGGVTGAQLCRALTEFAAYTNRLNEEAAGLTKKQLDKTLKSMDNFRLALDVTRNSIEQLSHSNATAAYGGQLISNLFHEFSEPKEEPRFSIDS